MSSSSEGPWLHPPVWPWLRSRDGPRPGSSGARWLPVPPTPRGGLPPGRELQGWLRVCAARHVCGNPPRAHERSAPLLVGRPWPTCPLPAPLPTWLGGGVLPVSAEPRRTGILTSGGLQGGGCCLRKVAQLALWSEAGSAEAIPPAPQPGASLGCSGPVGRGVDTAFQGQGRCCGPHSSLRLLAFPPVPLVCKRGGRGFGPLSWAQSSQQPEELSAFWGVGSPHRQQQHFTGLPPVCLLWGGLS